MKHIYKVFLVTVLMLMLFALTAGCGQEQTPYQINDGENFNYSVKYDANGGTFTTNTSVIVDCYDPSQSPKNEKGEAEIALLPPDDSRRGNDAFAAVKNGYFLAGWYAQRQETVDGDGNTVYSYADRWDFENDTLIVDPQKTYTAQEPALTLYAAWVPLFQVRFIDLATGEQLQSYSFDPASGNQLQVPVLNEETGAMDMFRFPKRAGYTFQAAFLDASATEAVTGSLTHPGTVDAETGTAVNGVLNVYTQWREGEWYHIFHADQLVENASVTGSYEIHADLDFEGKIWPTALMYGNFTGTIQGNGHTLKNISLEQTNNSKTAAGLFGTLTETAVLENVAFENVTFTIKSGTRVAGTAYGLLAGSVSSGAALDGITITGSRLLIHGNAYFGTEDYTIGLVCGMGQTNVDPQGITVGTVETGILFAQVQDGYVTLTDVPPEVLQPQEETVGETRAETVEETTAQ